MSTRPQVRPEAGRQELRRNPGFLSELSAYFLQSRKWYLVPVLLALLLLGVLIALGGSAAAPFIYTLF